MIWFRSFNFVPSHVIFNFHIFCWSHYSIVRKEWNLQLLLNIATIHILAEYKKTMEIRKVWSQRKFLRILSRLQCCLFGTSTIFIIEVRRFCIYMYWDRSLILHNNFPGFEYFLLFLFTFCILSRCPSLTEYTNKWAAPQCLQFRETLKFSEYWKVLPCNNIEKNIIFQIMSLFFKSVSTLELATCECNP